MKRFVHLFVCALLIFATALSLSSCVLKRALGFLYDCDTCYDEGVIECSACEGKNVTACTLCDGSGERECDLCSGFGRKKCAECGGDGGRYSAFSSTWFDCFYCTAGYASCPKTMSCGCVNGKRACVDCGATGLTDCPDCEQ